MEKLTRRRVYERDLNIFYSLTICTQEDYDRWKRNELIYSRFEEALVERDIIDEDCLLNSDNYILFDDIGFYEDGALCKRCETTYTLPDGQKVVAFGYIGAN